MQLENAFVIRAEIQFARRAEHPIGEDASDLAPLEPQSARKRGADGREWIHPTGRDVGSAADHLDWRVARVHRTERQSIRVGMPFDVLHPRHHDLAQIVMDALHRIHRRAKHGETLRGVGGIQALAKEIAEPVDRGEHRYSTNWSRNRMSFW